MQLESAKNKSAKENLEGLYDIEIILGLPCVLLLLEAVHTLIKIAWRRYVCICDLVSSLKLSEAGLYCLYLDKDNKFQDPAFSCFADLVSLNNDIVLLV